MYGSLIIIRKYSSSFIALHTFFVRKLVMLLVLVLKFLKHSKIYGLFYVVLRVRRKVTYKTENRNNIMYLLLHKNDFNNLNLSHITSGLIK